MVNTTHFITFLTWYQIFGFYFPFLVKFVLLRHYSMASSSNVSIRPDGSSATTIAPPIPVVQVIPNDIVPLNLCLDCKNFFYWQSQVLSTVRMHQLKGFFTGSRARPCATITNLTN